MFADDTTIPLPALYVEASDPVGIYTDGRSFVKRMWLDTSTGTIGTLKKRNAGNTGWDTLINYDAAAATLTTEQVQDIVGAMFPDTATIDWTYDDATGVVNGVVIGAAPAGSAGGALGGTYPSPTVKVSICIACSDETTALTTGTAKVTFRMPHAMTLTAVRASLTTAQASGSIFTVDINESGSTILSTKITIDNGEKTSTTAATAPVISDSALADDVEITIDIDQIGTSGAAGLKIYLIGTRS